MMGKAVLNLDVPVCKGTNSVTVLSGADAHRQSAQPCIRCGKCVEACPMDAIRMDTGIYALTGTKRDSFVIGLNELLRSESPFTEEEYKKGSK